jgi:hypothetical protein
MGVRKPFANLALFIVITVTAAFPAGANPITVEPNTPTEDRWTISSAAYRMVVNLASPRIDSFATGNRPSVQMPRSIRPRSYSRRYSTERLVGVEPMCDLVLAI